jgi:hypothetical protein
MLYQLGFNIYDEGERELTVFGSDVRPAATLHQAFPHAGWHSLPKGVVVTKHLLDLELRTKHHDLRGWGDLRVHVASDNESAELSLTGGSDLAGPLVVRAVYAKRLMSDVRVDVSYPPHETQLVIGGRGGAREVGISDVRMNTVSPGAAIEDEHVRAIHPEAIYSFTVVGIVPGRKV